MDPLSGFVDSYSQSAIGINSPYKRIEEQLGEKQTTLWVGNIAHMVNDTIIENILQCCGNVKRWMRVFDHDDKPKGFGFCEYDSADSTLRCIKLLSNFPIFGKNLQFRMDENTKMYLEKYETLMNAVPGFSQASIEADRTAVEHIEYVLTVAKEMIEKIKSRIE